MGALLNIDGIIGNVSGGLVRSDNSLVAKELFFNNSNIVGEDITVENTSTLRVTRLERLAFAGTKAGTIGPVQNSFVEIWGCFFNGADAGIEFNGIITALKVVNCSAANVGDNFIGFDINATVPAGISFSNCDFLFTQITQTGINFAGNVNLFKLNACSASPTGQLLTGITTADIRLVAQGNFPLADTLVSGEICFNTAGIVTVIPAMNTFVDVVGPWMLEGASERWGLVNGNEITYTGLFTTVKPRMIYNISGDRVGAGTALYEFRVVDSGGNPLAGSNVRTELNAQARETTGQVLTSANIGDSFRLQVANITGTQNIRVFSAGLSAKA